MRSRIAPPIAALVLSVALAACSKTPRAESRPDTGTAAAVKVDKRADEQALRDLGERWNRMFAAKDASGIAGLFADDGYELIPNTKAMKGPEEVRKGFGEFLSTTKDFKLTFAPTAISIADAGDLAVERGTYHMSFSDPKGKKVEDHGHYVTAWKKVNDQWKVMADINASEVPMPM